MGEAVGRRSPLGSGHTGLESGEVQVAVPEEWVRFSCLTVPSASASSHIWSGRDVPGQGPTLNICAPPPLEFLCQTDSNSSRLRSQGTGGSPRLAGKGGGRTGDGVGWVGEGRRGRGTELRRGREGVRGSTRPQRSSPARVPGQVAPVRRSHCRTPPAPGV